MAGSVGEVRSERSGSAERERDEALRRLEQLEAALARERGWGPLRLPGFCVLCG